MDEVLRAKRLTEEILKRAESIKVRSDRQTSSPSGPQAVSAVQRALQAAACHLSCLPQRPSLALPALPAFQQGAASPQRAQRAALRPCPSHISPCALRSRRSVCQLPQQAKGTCQCIQAAPCSSRVRVVLGSSQEHMASVNTSLANMQMIERTSANRLQVRH